MDYKKQGFTLIELIMVMAIITILSVSGAWLMIYLVQNSIFIPNQINMSMLATDAQRIMIEGDSQTKGLRFSKSITNIQNNQLTFNNQDNQSIRYRLDTASNKLYRSISGNPETLIPYYSITGISITGVNSILFAYYDAGDIMTANPTLVRRIKISLVARTGSGAYADWEGQAEQSSSIKVNKFQ